MSDHDPFNDPTLAHSRAQDLMPEEFLWDCSNDWAPFGSDEGWTAYYEWRRWREENPSRPVVDCFSWILDGRIGEYNESMYSDERIAADLENPDGAFMAEAFDIFTLDATIIATGLGQLVDEGRIDDTAKPFINVAIGRQLNPRICSDDDRSTILNAVKRAVAAA